MNTKRKATKSTGLKSLTKHAHSIDDLLAQSDVNEILENLNQNKADISEILIIYKKHDEDNYHWQANDLEFKECLWMLETVRQALFNDDTEE